MSSLIECPWCKNKYTSATGFNNHFYDEDLTDIHIENKDYNVNKSEKLINQYYTALEKQERKIKRLKILRERENRGDIKQFEINDILKSL
jgi:hypothetical protein